MRWFAYDVDFEMYGKDLTESNLSQDLSCSESPPKDLPMNYF